MQDSSFQNTRGRYGCAGFLEMSRKPFSKQNSLFVKIYLLGVIWLLCCIQYCEACMADIMQLIGKLNLNYKVMVETLELCFAGITPQNCRVGGKCSLKY